MIRWKEQQSGVEWEIRKKSKFDGGKDKQKVGVKADNVAILRLSRKNYMIWHAVSPNYTFVSVFLYTMRQTGIRSYLHTMSLS